MSLSPITEPYPHYPQEEANLKHYLAVLRRRKGVAVLVFLVVMAIGIGATGLIKPVYRTTTRLLVPVASKAPRPVQADDPVASIEAAAVAIPPSLEAQAAEIQSATSKEAALRELGRRYD